MNFITNWWEKNGFALMVIGSILFIVICWVMGWKPKKGSSGKIKDYIYDILNENITDTGKIKKKKNYRKNEDKCRNIVEDIFERPFPSMRPDFLKNPETGRNLECDLMNPDLKICIERHGEQHYKHVDHFHTKHDFKKQLERDQLKEKLLAMNGYKLYKIPYTVHYDVLDKYILEMLRKDYRQYVDRYCRSNGIILN